MSEQNGQSEKEKAAEQQKIAEKQRVAEQQTAFASVIRSKIEKLAPEALGKKLLDAARQAKTAQPGSSLTITLQVCIEEALRASTRSPELANIISKISAKIQPHLVNGALENGALPLEKCLEIANVLAPPSQTVLTVAAAAAQISAPAPKPPV